VEEATSDAVQTRPFIFGSMPEWQMSKDLWDRMHMLNLSATWDLWFVESEQVLTSLIEEMVADNMNFIAHLYSPTNDLGAFDWEKLNFPFPQETTCYEDKTCEEKLDVLFKTVNVKAAFDFPEVTNFLSRVRLNNINVNSIIAASNEYENSTVFDSVCTWLQGTEAIWSDWIVDIQREIPVRLNLEIDVMIGMWIATGVLTVLTCLALKYLLQNRDKGLVMAVSPQFLTLAAVSGILVAFAGVLWTFDDYEYGLVMCATRWIFSCTGNTILFASLTLKTWRVWHIFHNKGRGSHSNRTLFKYLGLVFIPVAALLLWKTWEVFDKGLTYEIASDGIEYQYECPNTTAGVYLFSSQVILAFVALFFCLKARDIPDDFNEIVHIMYLCIFTMLLMGFAFIVFKSAGDTPRIRAIIVCLSHLMAAIVIEISVLGRTLYLLLIRGTGFLSKIELEEVGN